MWPQANSLAKFVPGAGAILSLLDGAQWLIGNLNQFAGIVKDFADALEQINSGNAGLVAGALEKGLEGNLPLLMSFLASQLGLGTLRGQIKGLLDYVPGQIDKLLTQAVGAFAAKLRGAWGTSATLYDGIMGSPVDFNYGNVAYVLWVASKDGQTPQVLVARAGASRPIGALKASSFDDTVSPGAQGLLTALVNAAKALAAATKSKQTKASDLVPLEAAVVKAAKPVVSAIQANACVVLNAGCFAAGTKVLTPSGWVAVEELEVGQLVRSRPEDDAHAATRWNAVEARFDRTGCILHLHVGGEVIRTTPEHPFYVFGKGWTEAGALQAGDWLSTLSGGWVAVEEVYDTGCYETVYNVRVAEDHTYFVGQEGWAPPGQSGKGSGSALVPSVNGCGGMRYTMRTSPASISIRFTMARMMSRCTDQLASARLARTRSANVRNSPNWSDARAASCSAVVASRDFASRDSRRVRRRPTRISKSARSRIPFS